jgi:hypothetical protein
MTFLSGMEAQRYGTDWFAVGGFPARDIPEHPAGNRQGPGGRAHAEAMYDIWLNGLNKEVMFWVDDHGQTPSGSVVATTTFSARPGICGRAATATGHSSGGATPPLALSICSPGCGSWSPAAT